MHTVAGKAVGSTGFGLMGFTWRPIVTPDEQAFAAMRAALDAGCNLWNTAEFYGNAGGDDDVDGHGRTANLQLLRRYFTRYPEDAERVVLTVKGGVDLRTMRTSCGADAVRASVANVVRVLAGTKTVDVYACARVDPAVPVEETVRALADCVAAGQIRGIGLSEAGPATIRRAHAVHPIASIEVEVSLWAREVFDGAAPRPGGDTVAAACAELGIPIIGYSPLGRGFLAGSVRRVDDLPEGDIRRGFDRFQPTSLERNLRLVDVAVNPLASRMAVSPAQLCLAWVRCKGSGRAGRPAIVPIPGATTVERVRENAAVVELSDADERALDEAIAAINVVGGRYNSHMEPLLLA